MHFSPSIRPSLLTRFDGQFMCLVLTWYYTLRDGSRIPRKRESQPSRRGRQPTILQKNFKNRMKSRNFWAVGGGGVPLDPPLTLSSWCLWIFKTGCEKTLSVRTVEYQVCFCCVVCRCEKIDSQLHLNGGWVFLRGWKPILWNYLYRIAMVSCLLKLSLCIYMYLFVFCTKFVKTD